jgi:thioredoxin reductase (NADPH)
MKHEKGHVMSEEQKAEQKIEKVTILGTGPAGLTAAIYTARADLNPLCIEGMEPGGQLTLTTEVDNYPGFSQGIMGPEMMTEFRKQAERFGTRIIQGKIEGVDFSQRPFVLKSSDGKEIRTETLIITTGASARWIGLDSEKKLMGKGVSSCATCDGFFFRDQEIAVVGGGDTAMEEATFLTKFAKKVTVIHRRDTLRASKIMQQKAMDNPKIEFIWDTVVEEVLGESAVEGLRLRNRKTDEVSELKISGVFVAIGHKPNTEIFKGELDMDETGYLLTEPDRTKTKIRGVFAAGDVTDHYYRQAVTAAGMGCMAAIEAERFLEYGE